MSADKVSEELKRKINELEDEKRSLRAQIEKV